MFKELYSKGRKISFNCPPPGYLRLSPVEVSQDGTLVRSSEYTFFNPSQDFGELKSSDFGIRNLIAVGAYDKLQPVILSKDSDMSFADKFNSLITTENV